MITQNGKYSSEEIWKLTCAKCNKLLKLEFPPCKEGMASASCCNQVFAFYPTDYVVAIDEL